MESRQDHIAEEGLHRARDVRGAEIILTTRRRRLFFISGLVASAIFGLIILGLAASGVNS